MGSIKQDVTVFTAGALNIQFLSIDTSGLGPAAGACFSDNHFFGERPLGKSP